ncbi:unnamed protein product [Lota lota]
MAVDGAEENTSPKPKAIRPYGDYRRDSPGNGRSLRGSWLRRRETGSRRPNILLFALYSARQCDFITGPRDASPL